MPKHLAALAFAVLVSVAPAHAQDDAPLADEMEEGFDLLERGSRLLLESLIEEMGPAWAELRFLLNELNAYHPPEILPNGDIIIRRKAPLAPDVQDEDTTEL